MIKENQKYLNRFQIILDGLCVFISILLSWCIRFKTGWIELNGRPLALTDYLRHLVILIPLYLVMFNTFKLYKTRRIVNLFDEIYNIIKSNIVSMLIYTLFLYITKQVDYSRYFLLIFSILCTIFLIIQRGVIRYFLMKIRENGRNLKHIIIVGYSDLAVEFISKIYKNKHWGYKILGMFDDTLGVEIYNSKLENKNNLNNKTHIASNNEKVINELKFSKEEVAATSYTGLGSDKKIYNMDILKDIKILGTINDLEIFSSKHNVDEIFITLNINEYSKLGKIIESCEKCGIRSQIIPDYYKYIPAKPYVEEVEGLPIINIRYIPLDNIVNKVIKRIFDIVGALVALIIFSPIMLTTAIITKITSPGPVMFKQERVGLNRKKFTMYKFRSMHVQNKEEEKVQWTTKNDPRKTKFGAFIRKTSIDELPQFLNVLKGDMSLIGPRPERPYFVNKFKEEIPKYMVKHQVRPGITGWAQANGLRGDTSISKRIEYDIYYIENWSLIFDIKIMWFTVFKGFINKNAY